LEEDSCSSSSSSSSSSNSKGSVGGWAQAASKQGRLVPAAV
jgi:hypothetical protein